LNAQTSAPGVRPEIPPDPAKERSEGGYDEYQLSNGGPPALSWDASAAVALGMYQLR